MFTTSQHGSVLSVLTAGQCGVLTTVWHTLLTQRNPPGLALTKPRHPWGEQTHWQQLLSVQPVQADTYGDNWARGMKEEEIVWFPERPPTTQLCVLLPVTVTTHLKSWRGKSRLILQVEPACLPGCGCCWLDVI